MNPLNRLARFAGGVVTAGVLALSLCLPLAQAALVDTETAVDTPSTQQESDRTQDALNREAVKAKLLSHGVDSAEVQARVDALTENEAQRLAQQMDQLPAGGDVVTVLLVIILLILIL
jgi:hypothetical protein